MYLLTLLANVSIEANSVDLQEQSDHGLNCWLEMNLNNFSRQQIDNICCDWYFKGYLTLVCYTTLSLMTRKILFSTLCMLGNLTCFL